VRDEDHGGVTLGVGKRRTILLAVSAAIVLLAGVAALEAARDLHALLELAQAAGKRSGGAVSGGPG